MIDNYPEIVTPVFACFIWAIVVAAIKALIGFIISKIITAAKFIIWVTAKVLAVVKPLLVGLKSWVLTTISALRSFIFTKIAGIKVWVHKLVSGVLQTVRKNIEWLLKDVFKRHEWLRKLFDWAWKKLEDWVWTQIRKLWRKIDWLTAKLEEYFYIFQQRTIGRVQELLRQQYHRIISEVERVTGPIFDRLQKLGIDVDILRRRIINAFPAPDALDPDFLYMGLERAPQKRDRLVDRLFEEVLTPEEERAHSPVLGLYELFAEISFVMSFPTKDFEAWRRAWARLVGGQELLGAIDMLKDHLARKEEEFIKLTLGEAEPRV